jgi:hypothetical protein
MTAPESLLKREFNACVENPAQNPPSHHCNQTFAEGPDA